MTEPSTRPGPAEARRQVDTEKDDATQALAHLKQGPTAGMAFAYATEAIVNALLAGVSATGGGMFDLADAVSDVGTAVEHHADMLDIAAKDLAETISYVGKELIGQFGEASAVVAAIAIEAQPWWRRPRYRRAVAAARYAAWLANEDQILNPGGES